MTPGITVKRDFYPDKIAKQGTFALAQSLTATAKQAQGGVLASLQNNFTLRGNWSKPSNKFGIKIKAATKANLRSEVGTNADWLELHETGGEKTPKGTNLAIPTSNVRRTKRMIIQKSQRPGALRGKRDVVLQTKSGLVLFQRKFKGKRSKLVPLYTLERRARIRKKSPVIVPAVRVIRQRLMRNFNQSFMNALKNAK